MTMLSIVFFFFNDTATTEIYTLSLHDALPICPHGGQCAAAGVGAAARARAARAPAHAAAFVRHPRAAVLAGPARRAGAPRPRQHRHYPGLHPPRFPGAGEGVRRRASARAQEDRPQMTVLVLKKGRENPPWLRH